MLHTLYIYIYMYIYFLFVSYASVMLGVEEEIDWEGSLKEMTLDLRLKLQKRSSYDLGRPRRGSSQGKGGTGE